MKENEVRTTAQHYYKNKLKLSTHNTRWDGAKGVSEALLEDTITRQGKGD